MLTAKLPFDPFDTKSGKVDPDDYAEIEKMVINRAPDYGLIEKAGYPGMVKIV